MEETEHYMSTVDRYKVLIKYDRDRELLIAVAFFMRGVWESPADSLEHPAVTENQWNRSVEEGTLIPVSDEEALAIILQRT